LTPQTTPLNHPPPTSQPTPPPSIPAVKSEAPPTPAVKSEIPAYDANEVTAPNFTAARSPETPAPSVSYTITIPSYSGWFSSDEIHETERKILPEFFDGKSPSRNPRIYKYIRDAVIKRFRANPSRKITFTEARRAIASDVGSIRRVFDFLEAWGLVNYVPSAKPFSKEKRDVIENIEKKKSPKKLCSDCKTACKMVCFATDKANIILCTRCFVRENYRPGLSSTDFKRVDISEDTKADWTDKETLHLLEAVLHYGEDWKKVAEHVGSRNEKDCVARFIRLPFGEQFMGPLESEEYMQYQKDDTIDNGNGQKSIVEPSLSKRRCLTPLADASNPIMAQVAFLSAVVGSEVAGAAAQSAIAALDDVNQANIGSPGGMEFGSSDDERQERDDSTLKGQSFDKVLSEAAFEAETQLEKEQQYVEQSITDIVEAQMKTIKEKIEHFEDVELQVEKEWLQLRHMKDLFFADRLALLQHKARLTQSTVVEKDKNKTSGAT
ncbi:SWI/SNF complex subunit SWI3B, partial [Asparagus officinalis]